MPAIANPLFDEPPPPPPPPHPHRTVWRRGTSVMNNTEQPSRNNSFFFVGEDPTAKEKKSSNALDYFSKLRKKVRKNKVHIQTMSRAGISVSTLHSSVSSTDLSDNTRPPSPTTPRAHTPPATDNPTPPDLPTKWTPNELAKRISSLITSPTPIASTSSEAQHLDVPATPTVPVEDTALVQALCSPEAMNGSKGKPSVWDALTRRVSSRPPGSNDLRSQRQSLISDGSSIMLYSPLLVDEEGQVEIARSEVRSICITEEIEPHSRETSESTSQLTAQDASHATSSTQQGSSNVTMWVPSRDKISVQMFWWGYRMYLPPPVLETLSSNQLEAAKRAALITGALKWLITNIPTAGLPPQLQPITLLLSGLVPLVGFIGGFLAWSWTAIKSFDEGYGIYLSATWLLPIALIPGTWHEDADTASRSQFITPS